jgi:hypothetical protein
VTLYEAWPNAAQAVFFWFSVVIGEAGSVAMSYLVSK